MSLAPALLAAALLVPLPGAPSSLSAGAVPDALEAAIASADSGLPAAAEVALAATRLQAALLGVAPPLGAAPPPGAAPSAAVDALLARHGVVPTAAQAAQVRGLDTLPPPARGALAAAVFAFLAFDDASRAGDAGAVLASRARLLEAAVGLPGALPSGGPVLALPPALVLDLRGEASVHTADAALLVDAGGDDVYLNNAGGSNLFGGACLALVPAPHPTGAAAAIDLGGHDRYLGGYDCGANGGGSLGAGFLLDAAGDDVYVAGHDGGNGGGATGTGFLLDAAGNDVYIADRYAANGAGYAGMGLLVDGGGDDVYQGAHCGSNGGGHAGLGMLLDLGGNDAYRAGDIAANGGAFGGGVGLLWDEAGDDTYVAAGLGANGGSAGGLGLLLDRGGRDLYEDAEGGSGLDRTVVPKGALGAQVDA